MANVLNLTLKKGVAEGLLAGGTEIKLDKNAYWSKRLLENPKEKPENYLFKSFDEVSVAYGSDDKLVYPIVGIRGNTSAFYITIENIKEDVEEEDASDAVDPDIVGHDAPDPDLEHIPTEDEKKALWDALWKQGVATEAGPEGEDDVNPEDDAVGEDDTENDANSVGEDDTDMTSKGVIVPDGGDKEPIIVNGDNLSPDETKSNIEKLIDDMLTDFCKKKNVIEVSIPVVRVSHDGKVFGYNKVIHTLGRTETVLKLTPNKMFHFYDVSDEQFVDDVKSFLNKTLIVNAVFVWKNKCNYKVLPNGYRILTLYLATQRISGKMFM